MAAPTLLPPATGRTPGTAGAAGRAGAASRVVTALRSRDVAIAYALVVAAASAVLLALPSSTEDDVLAHLSTSVANLGRAPLFVLVASAFVVSSPVQLLLLAPLVAVHGELQRRHGRAVAIAVGAAGHVGATLLVAAGLAAGIDHGALSASLAHATDDVGVSYGLLTAAGLLSAHLPERRRRTAVAAGTAALLVLLGVEADYTSVGHLLAWGLGLAAAVAVRSRRARPRG